MSRFWKSRVKWKVLEEGAEGVFGVNEGILVKTRNQEAKGITLSSVD